MNIDHFSHFPAYKNRELSFVFKPSTTRAHSRRNVDRSKMVTYLKTAFLLLFIWIFLSQDRLTKFSTGESFSSLEIQLIIHISATLTWTLASGNLTIMGFHRYHREIGYTALLSMIVVSGTAVHLVIQNFQTSIMEHLGFVSTFHVIFHSVSNLNIAIIVPVFLGHGLSAARCKDSKTHSNIMSTAHFLVAVNILPRVFAVVLRWTFPFQWMDGDMSFSVACLIQGINGIKSIRGCRDEGLRKFLIEANTVSLCLSFLVLVCEWYFGFTDNYSFLAPVMALVLGYFLLKFRFARE